MDLNERRSLSPGCYATNALVFLKKKSPSRRHGKKKKERIERSFFFLERETRFELATFTLARWHSTTESLPHLFTTIVIILHQKLFVNDFNTLFLKIFNLIFFGKFFIFIVKIVAL